jgi:hypothetical protein
VSDLPEHDLDAALDRLFARARVEPPADLALRLVARLGALEAERRAFWASFERTGRLVLQASLALLLVGLLALGVVLLRERLAPPEPTTSEPRDQVTTVLAYHGRLDTQLATAVWPLGEDE